MFDTFMKIDGIDGESSDANHIGWIELLSMQNGLSKAFSRSVAAKVRAESRAQLTDILVSKYMDVASVKIYMSCLDGTEFETVTIDFCRAGGDKVSYMKIELESVLITSVTTSAHPRAAANLPVEDVSLSFVKIKWQYMQQLREDGGIRGTAAGGWSLAEDDRV